VKLELDSSSDLEINIKFNKKVIIKSSPTSNTEVGNAVLILENSDPFNKGGVAPTTFQPRSRISFYNGSRSVSANEAMTITSYAFTNAPGTAYNAIESLNGKGLFVTASSAPIAIITSTSGDINITSADKVTVTGKVNMLSPPNSNVIFGLTHVNIGGGASGVSGGNLYWDTTSSLTNGTVITAAPYDRWICGVASLFSPGTYVARFTLSGGIGTPYAQSEVALTASGSKVVPGFLVPSNLSVTVEWSALSSGADGQIQFSEIKFGL
jgi:hypothetical protein